MNESPTLADLQAQVQVFSDDRDWGQFHSTRNLAMALSVEAGELLELFLWCADDGPQPLNASRKEAVAEEAADVFLCLLNFCNRTEIDLSLALKAGLAKANRKYPADRVRGKALKYNEYDEWSEGGAKSPDSTE